MKLTRKQLIKMMAYHEAGHAVIARVLKININYVTILSPGDTAAAVALTHSATYHARDADQVPQLHALMMDAVVSLAGPHAEARHRLPKGRRIPDEWDDDRQHAMSFAREAALVKRGVNLREIDLKAIHALSTEDEAEVRSFIRHADNKARDLVAEHWPAITMVAEVLLSIPILGEADVDKLILKARTR